MSGVTFRFVGATALLLEVPDGSDVETWRSFLWRLRAAGQLAATEIIPGARTILIDGVADPVALGRALASRSPAGADRDRAEAVTVEIPVHYDGPDLGAVAELWGMSPASVVALHTSTEFTVAFTGFAPGFGYLTGLPPHLGVPRLATPRTRVEPGSVGLAGPYCGVYPTASPGGWQLIGRTGVVLFDPDRDPPALLTPGARVRFTS